MKVSAFIIHQGGNLEEEEVLLLEQLVRRNDKEMEEEEFWQNELLMEQESEQQLRLRLAELQSCVRDCEAKLEQYLARIEVGAASALARLGFRRLAFGASPNKLVPLDAEDGGGSGAGAAAAGGPAQPGGQPGGGTRVLAEAQGVSLNAKFEIFQLASAFQTS